jgi:predicted amidohydrolase
MAEAAGAGARLVQFPEGAITYPSKQVMAAGPDGELALADWSRAAWDVLREEAESTAALAGELRLWTAFGSIHPLTPPNRPHNSLFVVSDRGELVARYDKRFLSHTEVSYLYTPGASLWSSRWTASASAARYASRRTSRRSSPSTNAWTSTASCSP